MKIERFEDIEAWQLARELAKKVYKLTSKPRFARDFGLRAQIQDAAGSSMHNIAEGFDSETNFEFVRFLRYSKRSCTQAEFADVYHHAGRTRAAIRGFINYLTRYEKNRNPRLKRLNREP